MQDRWWVTVLRTVSYNHSAYSLHTCRMNAISFISIMNELELLSIESHVPILLNNRSTIGSISETFIIRWCRDPTGFRHPYAHYCCTITNLPTLKEANSAGTYDPMCARIANNTTWRRWVDFPACKSCKNIRGIMIKYAARRQTSTYHIRTSNQLKVARLG